MAEAGDKVADRYLLQEPIGRGGMGVVWRAHDELLDRQVAVKCARPDDDRAALRLTNEARNAARLHHPHIVSVFDFVEESEVCWIVMEYVSGGSLADMVRDRGALTPEEAGSIGCQIATALAKSHAEGVVHGDVTPENVLITEEGVAKLTDFGISRALWSEATMTRTGGVRGKPPYLPPEVARGTRPTGSPMSFRWARRSTRRSRDGPRTARHRTPWPMWRAPSRAISRPRTGPARWWTRSPRC
nr:serine/threonine-protein kinase [Streptomyces antimycoticus]